MTERRHHVSNSEIQTFKRCRRKWWLAYYRKLRPIEEKRTGALQLGTNIHAALEAYYSLEPQDPIEVIHRLYAEQRQAAMDADDVFALADINKDADLAHAMIEGYVDWVRDTGIDDDLEVVAVEQEISVDLDAVPVTLIGKLDTRIRRHSDGRLLSMDHKTCASIDGLSRTFELAEQPMMYQLLERLHSPEEERVTSGLYNMLRKVKRTAKAKPPFYAREQVHHNDIELRNFWTRLHGELEVMVTTNELLDNGAEPTRVVYPTPTSTCSWDCEFRAVCPLFDDGSHVEAMIEATYKVHNPYERYNMMETTI
jgi:RecB family exonuclease